MISNKRVFTSYEHPCPSFWTYACPPLFLCLYHIRHRRLACAYFLDDSYKVVEGLRGTCRQYAVTNGVSRTQRKKLELSGLAGLMDGIFVSEELGAPKPQEEFFLFSHGAGFNLSPIPFVYFRIPRHNPIIRFQSKQPETMPVRFSGDKCSGWRRAT